MAKYEISFAQLTDWEPCNLSSRKALFSTSTTLSVSQALTAGASISDILWVAGKLKLTIQCVIFAVKCAERVGYLNSDPRVQYAIEAAKNYIKNPTIENAAYVTARAAYAVDAARAAVDAARAAAYAVDAARAAARAAYVAARAADAAARAADAAAYAARAAYAVDAAADVAARAVDATDAARAEELKFQRELLIEIFETEN